VMVTNLAQLLCLDFVARIYDNNDFGSKSHVVLLIGASLKLNKPSFLVNAVPP
jgi:hypothetical protein